MREPRRFISESTLTDIESDLLWSALEARDGNLKESQRLLECAIEAVKAKSWADRQRELDRYAVETLLLNLDDE